MKQLDKNYFWLYFITSAFSYSILAIVLSFQLFVLGVANGRDNLGLPDMVAGTLNYVLPILIIVLILVFIWSKFYYKYYRYELTDNSFRKEYGVINKKYVSIPYDRIQNVNIHRSLMDRIFGISKISIETAGMNITEGYLPGLSKEVAESLRDELVNLSTKNKVENRNI